MPKKRKSWHVTITMKVASARDLFGWHPEITTRLAYCDSAFQAEAGVVKKIPEADRDNILAIKAK